MYDIISGKGSPTVEQPPPEFDKVVGYAPAILSAATIWAASVAARLRTLCKLGIIKPIGNTNMELIK